MDIHSLTFNRFQKNLSDRDKCLKWICKFIDNFLINPIFIKLSFENLIKILINSIYEPQ